MTGKNDVVFISEPGAGASPVEKTSGPPLSCRRKTTGGGISLAGLSPLKVKRELKKHGAF